MYSFVGRGNGRAFLSVSDVSANNVGECMQVFLEGGAPLPVHSHPRLYTARHTCHLLMVRFLASILRLGRLLWCSLPPRARSLLTARQFAR